MKKEKTFLQENWFKLALIALTIIVIWIIWWLQYQHNKNQELLIQKQIELQEEVINQQQAEEKKLILENELKIQKEAEIAKQNILQANINTCIVSAQNQKKKMEIWVFLDADKCIWNSETLDDSARCKKQRDSMLETIKWVYSEWESNCKRGIKNNF